MRILIGGAGEVGRGLAEVLLKEGKVVDTDVLSYDGKLWVPINVVPSTFPKLPVTTPLIFPVDDIFPDKL